MTKICDPEAQGCGFELPIHEFSFNSEGVQHATCDDCHRRRNDYALSAIAPTAVAYKLAMQRKRKEP